MFTEDGVDSSDFFACSDASNYEDQTRNLVRKLRNRTLEVRLVRIDVGWWDPRVCVPISKLVWPDLVRHFVERDIEIPMVGYTL